MNAVLIGMVVYVLAQFAVGAWVSRRMTTEADYILAGRRLGTRPGGVLGVCHLLRRRSDRRLGRLRLREGPGGRAGRPVRLRSRHHHRRPVLRPLAVVARADHLRRPVPPALFARRRAPGRDHPAAGLDHLGGRAGARVRPGAERQLRPRPRPRPSRWRRCWWRPTRWLADCSRTPSPTPSRASPWWRVSSSWRRWSSRAWAGSARRWRRSSRPASCRSTTRRACSPRSSTWPYPCAERSSPWS